MFTKPKLCVIIGMPNELNNREDRYIFPLGDNDTLFVHIINDIHLVKMRLPFMVCKYLSAYKFVWRQLGVRIFRCVASVAHLFYMLKGDI